MLKPNKMKEKNLNTPSKKNTKTKKTTQNNKKTEKKREMDKKKQKPIFHTKLLLERVVIFFFAHLPNYMQYGHVCGKN